MFIFRRAFLTGTGGIKRSIFNAMAQNKNALIRYRTIDKCLQNSYRQWTLDDLIEACSDALYEYEGKDSDVSKRTVQLDIQMMSQKFPMTIFYVSLKISKEEKST